MESPPRIFLDSSVLFSAVASATGGSRALIVLAELRMVRLVVSQLVFVEVERNLHRKAPMLLADFAELRASIQWEIVPDPTTEQVQACLQVIVPKDAPILAAALAAKPYCLVTLDGRDFDQPAVHSLATFPVQKPSELLENIRHVLTEHLR